MSVLPRDAIIETGRARPRQNASGATGAIYVVCSPRRGVGKTLLARLLAEFYVAHRRPVATFDLADEGPQLLDYLADMTTAVDISSTRGQMAFFDRLIAEKETTKIIDVSYRTFSEFFVIAHKIRIFEEACRRSIEPLFLFLIDSDPKSAKAYAMLQRWFPSASVLPVRNQSVAQGIPYWDAFPNKSPVHVSLEIPLISSVRSLIDRPSFSFARFRQTGSIGLPERLDGELRGFIKGLFAQFGEIEHARLCGDTERPWGDPR
jgi:hypothetical protein